MPFTQNTFAPVSASASNAPRVYSYSSSDNAVTVITAGYFESKKYQLEEGDWILAVLSDGDVLLQVLSDTSSVKVVDISGLPADNYAGGFFDYNDAATSTTPINVVGGGGFVKLTNDEAGPFTNKAYAPAGVTDVWDAVANEFDFTQLKLGDMVDFRLDLTVTTTSPNQDVDVRLFLGVGAGEYSIPFVLTNIKSTGTVNLNRYNGIYMGDTNSLNNPGEFRIQSDSNATVVVNGWYVKIIKRGQ